MTCPLCSLPITDYARHFAAECDSQRNADAARWYLRVQEVGNIGLDKRWRDRRGEQ